MKKTLQTIIDNAYKQWQEGIVTNHVPTTNECTLQVYIAYYLLQHGKAIAEKSGYDFKVLLEEDMGEIDTCKTKGHARCDIVVDLVDGDNKCRACIEMKRPEMKKTAKNAATTDARFAVLSDIENLEQYNADLKYEIAYTDYYVFPHSRDNVQFNISNGKTTEKSNNYKKDGKTLEIKLQGNYTFKWEDLPDNNPEHFFLKMKL